jgi:4'-phosphopantetheinyl transferase
MERINLYYLTRTMADLPPDQSWLSAGERARAAGLHVSKRRDDWLLGRWTAKMAIQSFLAMTGEGASEIGRLEIRSAPDGAPEAFLGSEPAPVSLALSHSGGRGFCAVAAPGIPLGCDLEAIQPRAEEFILDYFAAEERALVTNAPGAGRTMMATLLWSAKESALKCLREGLRRDTRSVLVHLEEGNERIWNGLTVRCQESSRLFHGWWRCVEGFVQTIAAGSPAREPVHLS